MAKKIPIFSTIPRHILPQWNAVCTRECERMCVYAVCRFMRVRMCVSKPETHTERESERMNESQSRKVANGNWDILLNVAENKNPNFLYSSNRESAHTHALMYHTHTHTHTRSLARSHIHINIDIITGCFWLFSLILSSLLLLAPRSRSRYRDCFSITINTHTFTFLLSSIYFLFQLLFGFPFFIIFSVLFLFRSCYKYIDLFLYIHTRTHTIYAIIRNERVNEPNRTDVMGFQNHLPHSRISRKCFRNGWRVRQRWSNQNDRTSSNEEKKKNNKQFEL